MQTGERVKIGAALPQLSFDVFPVPMPLHRALSRVQPDRVNHV